MRSEIEFEMWVRQPVEAVMDQVEQDAAHFKITPEELNRALFAWVMTRLKAEGKPDWLEDELAKLIE
jgi:hypothetical protein